MEIQEVIKNNGKAKYMNKSKLIMTIMTKSYKVQNMCKIKMHNKSTKEGQVINECKALQGPDIVWEGVKVPNFNKSRRHIYLGDHLANIKRLYN